MKKAILKINYDGFKKETEFIKEKFGYTTRTTRRTTCYKSDFVESEKDMFEIIEGNTQQEFAKKLLKNIDKVNLVTCKTCTAINCKNRNGNQYYLPCWTDKKNTVKVEIPEGYKTVGKQDERYFTNKITGQVFVNIERELQTGVIDLHKETIPSNIKLTYIDEGGNWKGYIK